MEKLRHVFPAVIYHDYQVYTGCGLERTCSNMVKSDYFKETDDICEKLLKVESSKFFSGKSNNPD